MTEFRVRIEVFEGPLDLLLTLVRREQLDITTVALARVTGAYLQYLTTLESLDPGALAAFIEVAATLLLLKSRALLPVPPSAADDDEPDPDSLVERLRAYRQYRRVAEQLGHRERAGLRAYARVAAPPEAVPVLAPGGASVTMLAEAFERALAEAVERAEAAPVGAVPRHRVRLSERLADIRRMLRERRRLLFWEVLLGDRRDREFIIVSFLAVLELLRRGVIVAAQDEPFGDIVLQVRDGADALLEQEIPIDDALDA